MSSPGDIGRRIEWVEGPAEDIVVKAIELVGTVPGAKSFELRYDVPGRELFEDEEPCPDEVVRWTATAELRRRYSRGAPKVTRTITGTADVEPYGSNSQGIVDAVVDLLEQLGANVVLLTGADQ